MGSTNSSNIPNIVNNACKILAMDRMMTNGQKEIRGYVIAGILVLSLFLDSIVTYKHKGYEYSMNMEQKTGQHWVSDLKGNPLGDY